MVPSGAMVGDAPVPIPSAPAGGEWLTTAGPWPGYSAKRNVQRIIPVRACGCVGGATAYNLPFMLGTYTVPPAPSATDDLSTGPVCAVQRTWPSGAIADSRPLP